MTTYHPVKGDAADVAFCTEYVEAAYLGEDSAYRYIETMRDSAIANMRNAPLNTAARTAWLATANAYVDALRVLDLAADAASRAYQRAVQA